MPCSLLAHQRDEAYGMLSIFYKKRRSDEGEKRPKGYWCSSKELCGLTITNQDGPTMVPSVEHLFLQCDFGHLVLGGIINQVS
jgi:hypothetical protein